MRAFLVVMGLLIICISLLGAASATPPWDEKIGVPLAHPVVLVCPNLVDLSWDPSPYVTDTFDAEVCTADWNSYRIRRGPDPYDVYSQSTLAWLGEMGNFYRDMTVAEGQIYWYDIALQYDCPSGKEHAVARKLGSTPVTIGASCLGGVVRDLTISGGELINPDMQVWKGATLTVVGTAVRGGSIASAGHDGLTEPPGGVIRIRGSTLEHTRVDFAGLGANQLTGSTIHGDLFQSEVNVGHGAEVYIAHNYLYTSSIAIGDSPRVTVHDNDFYHGAMTIKPRSGLPPDRISVDHNRFYDASQTTAIYQHGGSATYVGNTFEGTKDPQNTRDAIYVSDSLDSVPEPGVAYIRGNKIAGYDTAVWLVEGAVATLVDNVIRENARGMWVRYDAQATLEGNTFMDNVEGFRVWDEPTLTLHENCIARNGWGMYVTPFAGPALKADARENWWGHASGPRHPSNPDGQGDSASPQVDVSDWLLIDNCFVDVATEVISQTGGTVTSRSAKTSVSLPAGSVSTDTRVFLKAGDPSSMANMPPSPRGLAAVRLFKVSAQRVNDGTPVTSLAKEASITVSYSQEESGRVDEASMALYRLDPGAGALGEGFLAPERVASADFSHEGAAWVLLPGALDVEKNVLTAQTSDLGTFAVLGESTARGIYLPLIVRRSP